jgi:hypothetical protein
MVGELANELRLPVTDRNTLLAAAGFMPDRVTVDLHDDHFGWLRKSLVVTLRGMDPFAASAFDNYGNVHMVNRGWLAFHRLLLPDLELLPPLNSYHLYFAEQGLRPLLVDWEEVACRLLMTLQQEVLLSGDDGAERVLDELLRYPSIPGDWQRRAAGIEHQHSFRVRLQVTPDQQLSFLNVVYTAGDTPQVSEPRVLISLLIPEDPHIPAGLREACDAWQSPHPLLFY